jgi:uncharacterized protein involved in exopolysaccharide biosynthesis
MNPVLQPARGPEPAPPLTVSRWLAGVVLHWRLALLAAFAVVVLAVLAVVLLPPRYRATAAFIANPSSNQAVAGTLGSLGGLGGGLAAQLGISAGSDPAQSPAFYAELLRSRELQTRLLMSRFEDPRSDAVGDSAALIDILGVKGSTERERLEAALEVTRRSLRSNSYPQTNMVRVEASTRWPELSAAVTNRAIELVSLFNREQRVSNVGSRRQYLDERLADARSDLSGAENALRAFYDQNRQWRNAPNLVYVEQQLRRRVELASELHFTLQRQYDVARLDELNSAALITVVDSAVVPYKPQWPRYGVAIVGATVLALFAGMFVAGFAAVMDDWRGRDPDSARTFRDAFQRARADIGATLRGKRSAERERVA